jgi:uncharacterized protein GlcG (DUF336 family)
MTDFEQDQIDQAYMAQEDNAARRFRYHVSVNVADDEGKVIDTKGGDDKVLFAGTVSEAHAYIRDLSQH